MRANQILLVLLLSPFFLSATSFQTTQDGDWNDPNIWNVGGGSTPQHGDDIQILHNVVYNITDSIFLNTFLLNGGSFTVNTGADIVIDGNLAVNFDMTIANGAEVTITGSLDINNGELVLSGSNSKFRMSPAAASTVNINNTLTVDGGQFIVDIEGAATVQINTNSDTVSAINGAEVLITGTSGTFNVYGALIIGSGCELIADFSGTMNLNNYGSGSITFESGSSFYLTNPNLVRGGGGNPTNWQIQLANQAGWRHISSFFSGSTTLSEIGGTDFNPNYAGSGSYNIYSYNADGGGAGAVASGWSAATSNASSFEAGGASYAIYTGGSNYSFSNNGLVNITAEATYATNYVYTLYNSVSPDATNTGSPTEGDQGWNLIGNPYSAWYNVDAFLAGEMSTEYQGAHFWDPENNQYIAYLVSGESLENTHTVTGGTVGTTTTGIIQPFQAFWVKMSSSSGASMTVDALDDYRSLVSPTGGQDFFKVNSTTSRLRLDIFAESDSAWDQVLLAINPLASASLESDKDAFDRPAGIDSPNLAWAHSSGNKLSIDSRPLDSTLSLPLSMSQGIHGAHYNISHVEDQLSLSHVAILEDLKNGTLHDLSAGAYRFAHDTNYPSERFIVHMQISGIGVEEMEGRMNNYNIWTSGQQVHLSLGNGESLNALTVEFVDLSGRVLDTRTVSSTENEEAFNDLSLPSGLNLVRIKDDQGQTYVLKLIVY